MDKPIDILAFAKMIIAQYGECGISPLKLQKLAYYSKVWSLVGGRPLIIDAFKRWNYGPVNTELYHAYKRFGSASIPTSLGATCEMSATQHAIFQFVLDHYTQFSPYTLSEMTHHETPWRTTELNEIISDDLVLAHYSTEPFAQNIHKLVAGQAIEPYYKLRTNGHYAFVMDMSDEDAQRALTYPSYTAYKKGQEQAKRDVAELWATIG